MINWLKDAFGFSPIQEHTPGEFLSLLTAEEQSKIQNLWHYLLAHRQELGDVDISIALVGGIPRSVTKPNARRRPTHKDVDIVIATSAASRDQEKVAVLSADRILRDYLTETGQLDKQLYGPDWGYTEDTERDFPFGLLPTIEIKDHKVPKHQYDPADLQFITLPGENSRSLNIIFAGVGTPNMFKRPKQANNSNPYVVLYSTANISK